MRMGAGRDAMVILQRTDHAFKSLCFLRLRLTTPIKGETLPAIAAPDLHSFIAVPAEYLHRSGPFVSVTFVLLSNITSNG
jgi:hypothetical protein